jgi:hypothetical protein
MGGNAEFMEPKYAGDIAPQNPYNIPPAVFKSIITLSQKYASEAVAAIANSSVDLTDGATIAIDASLGSDFVLLISGNRTFDEPTNATDRKVIRIWIVQDGAGSRTATFDTVYRFPTDLPAGTLTATPNFGDLYEFIFAQGNNTWDCIRIVRGYEYFP